jgi:hypothetical protein
MSHEFLDFVEDILDAMGKDVVKQDIPEIKPQTSY